MSQPGEPVTHGRGGAGNIGADSNAYTDGEIIREGRVGDQGDGPFSTGRGGTGNIGAKGSPHFTPKDKVVVPETATKVEKLQSHHVGRGGAGNETHVHADKTEQHGFDKSVHAHEGFADKLKHLIGRKD